MRHLHLILADTDDLGELPYLARLIARGRVDACPGAGGTSAALAGLFGIDDAALAPYALAAEGVDPGAGAWFRADPVHLAAGMHSLTLLDRRHFALAAAEAAELVAALNRAFAGDVDFIAPHPTRWYARFPAPPAVTAPPLDEVAGAQALPGRLAGPDAGAVQRTLVEIQMCLHDHPVNAAREARGEPVVNGVWLWGGGRPAAVVAACDRVLADDFLARALAAAAGIPAAALPVSLPADPADGVTLAVLADPGAADRNWLKPALRAVQLGRLDRLELTLTGRAPRRCRLERGAALRFWRRS
ncbi:hypothetical protein EZJ19_14070 [Parasulfuritortus cantonensis]|uniref:Phosphoglycerate mutase n=1 Tax=Parasulfuritortus cantonensis TaxID=2528202 RepID=A0A4R1B7R4_9PROT|nr:hypothetical protein [Parasulfuritortus cantonensis]TCJ11779.1 hypothetical protein EZJ19_14070 [Parasulfuritortus cantonensis]